jgi:hypothetical protein
MVEIAGPASVAPGQSAQFSAIEKGPNGSSLPAPDVRWTSSAPSVLQVGPTGLASAGIPGQAVLSVEVPSTARRASREILVLPDGTYRLVGTVTEGSTGAVGVPDARVEARLEADGAAAPIAVATAASDGRYRLYGVPGQSYIRVSREGYLSTTERVDLAAHGTRDFHLEWDTGLSLAGPYTLAIEANSACPSAPQPLAPDLRRRTFQTVMTQQGSQLTVSLLTLAEPNRLACVSGPFVFVCQFLGRATAIGATFSLTNGSSSFYAYPDLVEALWFGLGNGPGLVVLGTATTARSDTGLSGNLAGSMTLYERVLPRPSQAIAGCGAGRFELTRR